MEERDLDKKFNTKYAGYANNWGDVELSVTLAYPKVMKKQWQIKQN